MFDDTDKGGPDSKKRRFSSWILEWHQIHQVQKYLVKHSGGVRELRSDGIAKRASRELRGEKLHLLLPKGRLSLRDPELAQAMNGVPFGEFGSMSGRDDLDFGILIRAWAGNDLVWRCPVCESPDGLLVFVVEGSFLSGLTYWTGVCIDCKKVSKLNSTGPGEGFSAWTSKLSAVGEKHGRSVWLKRQEKVVKRFGRDQLKSSKRFDMPQKDNTGYFELPDDKDYSEEALKPFGAKRIGNKIVCRADESLVTHEILPGEKGYDPEVE